MNLHAQHHARLRGTDLQTLRTIISCSQALVQIEYRCLYLGKLGHDLGNEVFVQLYDLQLRFPNLQKSASDR